jgi:RND family efflux transporter MFP subunit
VGVGQALVGIADVNPLQVKLYLPEQVVKSLRPAQPVEVRPDVASDEVLAGRVELISPVVDPQTATVKVTLKVDDLRGAARVGSFVRARITTDVHQQATAIPKRGVVSEAGASYVFVAQADSVSKVAVETGYADDDYIELTTGAKVGDRIVVVGQGGLRQGSKIRVLATPTPTADVAAKPQAAAADVDAGGH